MTTVTGEEEQERTGDSSVDPAGDPTIDPAGVAGSAGTADEAGTAPGDRRFRPDVEGLRAVAVVLVVLFHASLPGLHGGYVGVDVFFVISGFVITGLLLRERSSTTRTSLASFYGRRVRRILPAGTLVIVATVVATYVALGAVYGNPTAVAARWTAVFLANFHFAGIGTDYLHATLPPSPLQNFWSLAVEEQFYLVYPAIFLVAASIRSAVSLRARLVFTLVPIILASLMLSAVQTSASPTAAFFSPFTRAWELALGALVAVATPTLLRLGRNTAALMTWVGLAAIGYAAVTYSSATAYPGTAVIVPVVGTALVIAGGTPVPRWGAESVLKLAPFQFFGRLSYSLYLWHWPILIIAAEYAGKDSLPFQQNLGWLALALVASYATYRLIENPVRHAKGLANSRWLALVFGVVLIATSLIVATVALEGHRNSGTSPAKVATGTIPSLTPEALMQTVAAAPKITKLPADLTPSLAGVRADWGGPSGPCWPTYRQTSVPACVYGDPTGTQTLVLYGDSHAAMWFDVINLIAAYSHWRLVILTKGDCPTLVLPFRNPPGVGSPGGAFAACAQWHTFALDRIKAIHPDVVMITQDPNLGPGDHQYSQAQWEQAQTATIQSLPVPSSLVLVLGDIPQTANSGPACLSRYPRNVQRCSGQNAPIVVNQNRAEANAAAQTGARYIDVVPWFCSTICTGVVGHYQPYWDPYHITASYSMVLSQVLGYSMDLPAFEPASAPAPSSSASPAASSAASSTASSNSTPTTLPNS